MSKRQRVGENSIVIQQEVGDLVREIEDIVPGFSLENLKTQAERVQQLIHQIRDDAKAIYGLIRDREWQITAEGDTLIIEIHGHEDPQLAQLGIPITLYQFASQISPISYWFIRTSTPYACDIVQSLQLLIDKDRSPLIMLGRSYVIPAGRQMQVINPPLY